MNLNRRDFLKSLMAVSAVAMLPVSPAVETMPEWVVTPDDSSVSGTWISLDGKRYLLDYAQMTESIPYDSLDNTYSDTRISWSMGWDRQQLIEIEGRAYGNEILDILRSYQSSHLDALRNYQLSRAGMNFSIGAPSWPYIFQGKAQVTSIDASVLADPGVFGNLRTDFTLVCYGPLTQMQVRK